MSEEFIKVDPVFAEAFGYDKLPRADFTMHHVATIGDLEVESSKHLTNLKCDGEIIMSIMRKDGGLQELVDALQSQVIK